MLEIRGKYGVAVVYNDHIGSNEIRQIKALMNHPASKDTTVRMMPDVHAGIGCTIGTTIKFKDKICPNLVGVDIACGMLIVQLPEPIKDFELFDKAVHEAIPTGANVHTEVYPFPEIDNLAFTKANYSADDHFHFLCSIGTLGGGNHFIEVDQSVDGTQYLVIHSGSRNLGVKICEHYMKIAQYKAEFGEYCFNEAKKALIADYKKMHKDKEIQQAIKKLKAEYEMKYALQNLDLAYIEEEDLENYLHDCKIANLYARKNREVIAENILKTYMSYVPFWNYRLEDLEHFHCIHNYIDTDNKILRKGAISAQKCEKVIIPLNMRDGCIIGIGKGNPEWNFSGPHGAGRAMSRFEAMKTISIEEFTKSMEGIYSSTVNNYTIDEAPMAYKNSDDILNYIKDSVEVIEVIKPVYNFKASEK